MRNTMMDRDIKFKEALKKTMEENAELLAKLDDFDESGIPYWEHQLHDQQIHQVSRPKGDKMSDLLIDVRCLFCGRMYKCLHNEIDTSKKCGECNADVRL